MSSQSRPASPTTSPSSSRAPLSPSLPTWAPRRRRQGTFHQLAARVRGRDASPLRHPIFITLRPPFSPPRHFADYAARPGNPDITQSPSSPGRNALGGLWPAVIGIAIVLWSFLRDRR